MIIMRTIRNSQKKWLTTMLTTAMLLTKKLKKNGFEYKSIYHVEDTKENYDLISVIISERFNHWKENYMPKH